MQISKDHDVAEMLFILERKCKPKVFLKKKKKVITHRSNQLLLNLLQKQSEVPASALRWLCRGRFHLKPVHTLKGLFATKVTKIASL